MSKPILEPKVELKLSRAPTLAMDLTQMAKEADTLRCTNTCHQA